MIKKSTLAAIALLCAGAAQAATVTFTYNGTSTQENGVAVKGTGQFVTKNPVGAGTIGVDDLASFDFSFSYSYKGLVDTFTYSLADLSCPDQDFYDCFFSATLSDTAVTALSLSTVELPATNNWSQALRVGSLSSATTGNFDMAPLSIGTISARLLADEPNRLPEPTSWALAGLALAAGGFASRRRAR